MVIFLKFSLEIGPKPCMNFVHTLLSSVNNSIFTVFEQDLLERLLANWQGYGHTYMSHTDVEKKL